MRAAFIFEGLTPLGIRRVLLVIVIFGLFAWRIRRNMVIVLSSLTVILIYGGSLSINSWEHANSPLAALGAVVFIVALVVLGIVIFRLLSGIGTRPKRSPRRSS
jgi:hypothetical protein